MTSLIKKNLVSKDNKLPAKYRLTEDGRNLASKMLHGSKENTVPINQSGKIVNKIPQFFRKIIQGSVVLILVIFRV
jgi:hypothetical protein